MAFDYKKEFKEIYLPKKIPTLIKIPKMNYVAVRGKGNPNEENSEYKQSIETLYSISYTIKMSYKSSHTIKGFFPYVVPPLEGLWWQNDIYGFDYTKKDEINFVSMMRLPEFVDKNEFDWAVAYAEDKKGKNFSMAEFFTYDEGLCIQCMHIGSYDDEPRTIRIMNEFAESNNYITDCSNSRYHHEIYLSDPSRCSAEKLKTVIRIPVKENVCL